jgi:hypothetical protein
MEGISLVRTSKDDESLSIEDNRGELMRENEGWRNRLRNARLNLAKAGLFVLSKVTISIKTSLILFHVFYPAILNY